MRHIYTSVDIGSDTIKIVVCELFNKKLNLLAASSIKSKGIKKGLILSNGTGIIDSSYYPRNIGIKLYNTTDKEVVLEKNERVCQCIFEKYLTIDNDICANTERLGGFGSTGTR